MSVIPEQSKRCHQRLDALTVAEVENDFGPIIFLAIALLLDIVENVLTQAIIRCKHAKLKFYLE